MTCYLLLVADHSWVSVGEDMTGNRETRQIILRVVEKIVKEYRPKKVILFGSYAYGKPAEDSDVDLLIIKNTDKRPIDRWIEVKKLLRDTSRSLPVSPLVYTEEEIEERNAIKDFFIEEIFEKGEILYG
jgi:predicted nucleotidyltransferase